MRWSMILFLLVLFGCSGSSSEMAGLVLPDGNNVDPSVKVFSSRGSVQCTGGGTAPEVMRNSLISAGIAVRSFSCGNDGLIHATVCGGSDGLINIFEIPSSKLAQAQALGFADLSSLPSASVTACP